VWAPTLPDEKDVKLNVNAYYTAMRQRADQLDNNKHRHVGRGNAGKARSNRAGYGDCRIGKSRGRCEPVGGTDVQADRDRGRLALLRKI
jgi:hypothetical protein